MNFSTAIPALAIGFGVVSAAQHSGGSLKHIGKARQAPQAWTNRIGDAAVSTLHSAVSYELNSKSVNYFRFRISSSWYMLEYSVNRSANPEVDFDIGESYAGPMPISKTSNASQLYFWFFPSENPAVSDEILIWLNEGVSFIYLSFHSWGLYL
jgi:carboxypeptidase D